MRDDATTRRSRFYQASEIDIDNPSERVWLAPDLIPSGTVTLLAGDGGTGKSLLALQLAVAVTAGGAWLGKSVRKGRAIFLTAEDDDAEVHRRLHDITRSEPRAVEGMSDLTLRSLAGEDALLARDGPCLTASPLFDELEQEANFEAPELIVIDTLADVFPANENDRAKVRQFVGMLRGLALRQECALLVISHPSLTGLSSGTGTSGSTAWSNSVRSRLYLSRILDDGFEADPDRRVLTTKKNNYGRIGAETRMTWRDGVFVPEVSDHGLDKRAAGDKAQRVFLKLLAKRISQGRFVNAAGGPTYAPKVFAEDPDAEGMTKRAMKGAMESLFAAGKIKIESHGPASKRRSHIVEADQ
ncbi:RecA-family ATPase [Roseivivax halotolerans]|uniref:RecA-family ATPase n=1 Tax=Roseivivax halotolerans TaxID=93684 RepID=A0A1I5ZGY5_9RHOB|nr:AAA family ATPase [Roseivivax halotolerans]SFQ55705.1 RecA-family ATPase [Roseivivax halotolerans]